MTANKWMLFTVVTISIHTLLQNVLFITCSQVQKYNAKYLKDEKNFTKPNSTDINNFSINPYVFSEEDYNVIQDVENSKKVSLIVSYEPQKINIKSSTSKIFNNANAFDLKPPVPTKSTKDNKLVNQSIPRKKSKTEEHTDTRRLILGVTSSDDTTKPSYLVNTSTDKIDKIGESSNVTISKKIQPVRFNLKKNYIPLYSWSTTNYPLQKNIYSQNNHQKNSSHSRLKLLKNISNDLKLELPKSKSRIPRPLQENYDSAHHPQKNNSTEMLKSNRRNLDSEFLPSSIRQKSIQKLGTEKKTPHHSVLNKLSVPTYASISSKYNAASQSVSHTYIPSSVPYSEILSENKPLVFPLENNRLQPTIPSISYEIPSQTESYESFAPKTAINQRPRGFTTKATVATEQVINIAPVTVSTSRKSRGFSYSTTPSTVQLQESVTTSTSTVELDTNQDVHVQNTQNGSDAATSPEISANSSTNPDNVNEHNDYNEHSVEVDSFEDQAWIDEMENEINDPEEMSDQMLDTETSPAEKKEEVDYAQHPGNNVESDNEAEGQNLGKDVMDIQQVIDSPDKPKDLDLQADQHHEHKHKKEETKDEEGEEGDSAEHHEAEHEEKGDKGEKGYKKIHEHDSSEKGHHDKENHDHEYDEKDGKNKDHHEEAGHHEKYEKGGKGEKKSAYTEKGKHNKGHSTKGEHVIHNKNEFDKKTEFFDEFNEGGDMDKDGGYHRNYEHKKGDHFKKSHKKGKSHKKSKGNKKHHKKGHDHHTKKGHHKSEGSTKHHDNEERHGKKTGHKGSKKWKHKNKI